MGLEQEIAAPYFWQNNPDRAKEVSGRIASLKKEISRWEEMTSEAGTLKELWFLAGKDADEIFLREFEERLGRAERYFRELEILYLFSGKYDRGNALVSFDIERDVFYAPAGRPVILAVVLVHARDTPLLRLGVALVHS